MRRFTSVTLARSGASEVYAITGHTGAITVLAVAALARLETTDVTGELKHRDRAGQPRQAFVGRHVDALVHKLDQTPAHIRTNVYQEHLVRTDGAGVGQSSSGQRTIGPVEPPAPAQHRDDRARKHPLRLHHLVRLTTLSASPPCHSGNAWAKGLEDSPIRRQGRTRTPTRGNIWRLRAARPKGDWQARLP
jgi:hypothetical protein